MNNKFDAIFQECLKLVKEKDLKVTDKYNYIMALALTGLVLKYGIDKKEVIFEEYKKTRIFITPETLYELNMNNCLRIPKDISTTTDSIFLLKSSGNEISKTIALTDINKRYVDELIGAAIHESIHAINNNTKVTKKNSRVILSNNLTTVEKSDGLSVTKNNVYEEFITSLAAKETIEILQASRSKDEKVNFLLSQLRNTKNIDEIAGYPDYTWLLESLYNNEDYRSCLEEDLLGKSSMNVETLMFETGLQNDYNTLLEALDRIDLSKSYVYRNHLYEIKCLSDKISSTIKKRKGSSHARHL